MKKSVLIVCLSAFACSQAFAQRAVKTLSANKLVDVQQSLEHTESIKLEAGHEMLVTPLVASVKVLTTEKNDTTFERKTFTGAARKNIPEGLSSTEYLVDFIEGRGSGEYNQQQLMDLKKQVIYDFSRETDADLIVFPQFSIYPKTKSENTVDADGNTVRKEVPIMQNGKVVMVVEAVGFPAVYTGFREGTEADKWIKSLYQAGENKNKGQDSYVETESATKEEKVQ